VSCWSRWTPGRSASRSSRPRPPCSANLATLRNAERDLARYKDLIAQKLIAQQQYDQQRATVDSAKATVLLDQSAVTTPG
jgi:multidrug resistance efflux pump